MKILSHKLSWPKHAKTWEMLAGSCAHVGNPGFDEDAFRTFLGRCRKQPWIFHGDSIESILPGDKRHNVDTHKKSIAEQEDDIVAMVKEGQCAPMCVGWMMGNHEYGVSRLCGNISKRIADRMGVPFLAYSAMVDILTPDGKCPSYFHHGARSNVARAGDPEIRTARREVNLRKLLEPYDAYLKGIGHYHRHIVCPPVNVEKLGSDGVKCTLVPKPFDSSWHYAAPSFFRGYGPGDMPEYPELYAYGPTEIGWIGIVMNRDGTIAAIREYYGNGKLRNEYQRRTMI